MPKANSESRARSASRSLLAMTAKQARAFLLKPESYCNVDFPEYLQFGRLISAVAGALKGTPLKSVQKHSPRDCEDANYSLLTNKDGRYAWRPLQLIHPAIYVSLVHRITEPDHWDTIRRRFREFQSASNFSCLSIPVESVSRRKDKAEQILQWWSGIEQGSIERALDYSHVLQADIADCYGSIYTHSIAWALHERAIAKKKDNRKNDKLTGNVIDWHIQDMRHGQTNAIPQGSVLMDFIAEMVLGFADLELSRGLKKHGVANDFHILRYRDDYRIFVNDSRVGEVILKILTEVLIGLGLKLNSSKTKGASESVVHSSLKADKLAWLRGRQADRDLQKHLLLIHSHGLDNPNAGSLVRALDGYCGRLAKAKRIQNPIALASIAVDIAYTSPRVFNYCALIASIILKQLDSDTARVELIQKIYRKIGRLPNTGHMQIWLQRISLYYKPDLEFEESLCRVVSGQAVRVWNSDWISSKPLLKALASNQIVDRAKLKGLKPVMQSREIALFGYLD